MDVIAKCSDHRCRQAFQRTTAIATTPAVGRTTRRRKFMAPTRIFAGAGRGEGSHRNTYRGGLFRRLAGDSPWEAVTQGLPADCEVRTIAVHPQNPQILFVGTQAGPYRSSDGGETFTDISESLFELAQQPHLQSNVGGRHCGQCEGMLDSHALAISPALPETPFLAVRMGLFRSDNRGATWYDAHIGRFSPLTYCRDVAVSPRNPKVMVAAMSEAAFSTAGSLYRSNDLAQTWQRIDHGVSPDSTVMALSLHPTNPDCIYCVTRAGQVIGTEDGGRSWSDHPLPEGVHDVYAVACI
jgi:photosystem II stability/assembly factor-like uncharacterized protein